MKKAFTLIELLVTIVIMTVITAASVASLKGYKSRSYFNEAVSQVHGEVLKAQSLSTSPNEKDIDSYTLTFNANGSYAIKDSKGTTLDSGSTKGVNVSEASITFNKGGSSSGGTITVTDKNNPAVTKTITITPAGSVELK